MKKYLAVLILALVLGACGGGSSASAPTQNSNPDNPSAAPTDTPVLMPTTAPTVLPTVTPTIDPTTTAPTAAPTTIPTPTAAPSNTPAPVSQVTPADATRFLQQASFGPTEATIAEVRQKGFDTFLTEQFAAKGIGYETLPNALDPATVATQKPANCTYDGTRGSASSQCERDNYSTFTMQTRFFQNALNSPDQLRQRVAWALNQILVVSSLELFQAYSMQSYQRILYDNAFGNYRDILYKVTLSPGMGHYLNMVNNNKPTGTQRPNENYARELLQLFSIGQIKLNQDGTPVLVNGTTVPTYDQEEIEGFAYTFTGWAYPPLPGQTAKFYSAPYHVGSMVPIAANHATGTKKLLDGVILPANQSAEKDLNDALDNIFNHPNVAPFIGKLLIQQLVTSNPSPEYVARVSAKFNNNGAGLRGDMKAVVRAILLDAEARGDVKTDPRYGHLKEPALYTLNILRAMDAKTDGVVMRYFTDIMDQEIFSPPSVFNFYPPDYSLASEKITAPEFAIQNSSTAMQRINFASAMMFNPPTMYDPLQKKYIQPLPAAFTGIYKDDAVTGSVGTLIDWTPWQAAAADTNKLMEKINALMFHGSMSTAMKDTISKAVVAVAPDNPLLRARTAVYLAVTSSQYQVER
jgi:uncharacterized protein (DUF1800 family)